MAAIPPWKQYLNSLQIKDLAEIFRTPKPIIGMVHCWPLPGAPGYTGYGMDPIIENALRDAEALAEGGCDGLIVENMWDLYASALRSVSFLPPGETPGSLESLLGWEFTR
jgi:hypothetical protein